MTGRTQEEEFEQYRKRRQRRRSINRATQPAESAPQSVLDELEQVENSEYNNRRLTAEVNDFFHDATRTAANIVQRLTGELEEISAERLNEEMNDFLSDVIRRAEGFVQALSLRRAVGPADASAHEEIEPTMHNLVGKQLDSFRAAGTAQVGDKHLGQDPFDADAATEDKDHEPPLRSLSNPAGLGESPGQSEVLSESLSDLQPPEPAPPTPPRPAPLPGLDAAAPIPIASTGDTPPAREVTPASLPVEPGRLKAALKALVAAGVLGKEQAVALYRATLALNAARE